MSRGKLASERDLYEFWPNYFVFWFLEKQFETDFRFYFTVFDVKMFKNGGTQEDLFSKSTI